MLYSGLWTGAAVELAAVVLELGEDRKGDLDL